MSRNLEGLSSSQFAFRNYIILYKDFITEEDIKKSEPVYHTFKDKGRIRVGTKYNQKIYTINSFPFPFYYKPKKGHLHFKIEKMCFNLGFLNKDMSNKILMDYLYIVYENKYSMFNYDLNLEVYKKDIINGKDTELEEMDFSKRTYVFNKDFWNLSKSTKCRIMNKDRFKETIKRNAFLIDDAVDELCDSSDFIHNKLVSKLTNLNINTVKKYISIFKDRIDAHNKNNYGTDNYNTFLNTCSVIEIKDAINILRLEGNKINIENVSRKTQLHRNTVSRLNKKHNIF